MDLQTSFEKFVKQEKLFSRDNRLLLAVSGGLDSVVLSDLCIRSGYDVVLAHCNFQLRGEESERDEQFVRALASKYNKPILVKRFDTAAYAEKNKLSIQVAARELRYYWFYSLLESSGDNNHPAAQYILTAHHKDDNIETLLMNFFKGTGIAGLRAILPKQQKLIRPLLFAGRAELLQYAQTNNLQWVEDSSNASDKYTRNAIRHKLIPLVQELYPQAIENLGDNLQRFREIEMLYQQSINMHTKKLIEIKGSEAHIPVLKLAKVEPLHSILYEIIKTYGFTSAQVAEVVALLDSETGKYVQSSTHRVIRNRNWLIIAPLAAEEAKHILIESSDESVPFAEGNISLKRLPAAGYSLNNGARIAALDAKHVQFPLILRPWKKGDYFYPLGMTKKKKVARFLIDLKLSATAKEKVWVVEMNKKIIWIAGHRIDDRFRIGNATTEILELRLD
ncbi:tRNA lysidine(34) synthetase TilS [Pseudoflavitalea sp. G-6-1-2]|uniref:tRNA lysidine(34) synthetase TilS n=1 Tax=Pseudoflavitalea sp. G-6-1-2 TaxID=2728841 RepID=UPI00146EC7F2|nr:tRNA lysidine(34) synthetase TilS [Pseudoflavitalea sp. G-6-1-2]NML22297.1 tRNA lysidine(34) synthetase TilS [Pseudoflavitalea sp. G-6-1-2]